MREERVKSSVIIPVYNTKEYLEVCIESVLRQTQNAIEIILVDDGSTDGSREIIEEYVEKYPFVKAVYQENKKLGSARNAGIELAEGKYIYFLDSDDYIREDLLEKCYLRAEEDYLDFVMFDAATFIDGEESNEKVDLENRAYDRTDLQIGEEIYSGIEFWDKFYLLDGVYPNAYLVYINTQFLLENKILFEPGVYYEDNDWMVRMCYHAKRISYIPQQFYFRRIHVGSIMTSAYNIIHLNSCILLCGKMLDMIFYSEKKKFGDMIMPVLEMMLMRFEDIMKNGSEIQMSDEYKSKILEFYKKLIYAYTTFDKTHGNIKSIILAVADSIKKESEQSGLQMEFPDWGIENRKKELVFQELSKYPLNSMNKTIGIYGSGLMCDKFLRLYQKYIGSIEATLIFIDSYQKSGEKYRGYPLYNIKDVEKLNVDCIIIASSRYKDILLKNIEKEIKKSIEVMCLPKYIQYF